MRNEDLKLSRVLAARGRADRLDIRAHAGSDDTADVIAGRDVREKDRHSIAIPFKWLDLAVHIQRRFNLGVSPVDANS